MKVKVFIEKSDLMVNVQGNILSVKFLVLREHLIVDLL